MAEGFHNKYRPKSLKFLIGNERAVTELQGMVKKNKYPSAILFTGPPGAGKTTIARALAKDALEGHAFEENVSEHNFGSNRSIEEVRELIQTSRLRPAHGAPHRFFICDEAHQLVANKPAADAFLKPLEEPVPTTTFLLCSMDAEKFGSSTTGRAMARRCLKIHLNSPSNEDMTKYGRRIVKKEEVLTNLVTDEILAKVVENSESSFSTLANSLERISNYIEGLEKKPKALSLDQILEAVDFGVGNDDATAVRYLVAVYNMKYVAAHREILSITEPVTFINKVMWLNWFVQNQVLLKEARHPKVWGNKHSFELWKQVKELFQGMSREKAVAMVAGVTSFITGLKLSAGTFSVDEKVLFSAKTYELLDSLKG